MDFVRRHCARIWIAAIVVSGAVEAVQFRHSMNPDGISYLDLASAFRGGRWYEALDPYWSPGYPFVIALIQSLTTAARSSEFALVHVLNFLLFSLALMSWRMLLKDVREGSKTSGFLTEAAAASIGWSLFAWSVLKLISLRRVTPDLAVAAAVFAASALLIRISSGRSRGSDFVRLGAILGAGFLFKSVLFPIGVLAVVLVGFSTRRASDVARSAVPFLLLSALIVVPLSLRAGKPTFGDAGRLNYAWYVAGVTPHVYWQGDSAHGFALHPPRLLSSSPALLSFGEVFPGTVYPLWAHPSYWHEGLVVHFSIADEIRSFPDRIREWSPVLFGGAIAILAALVLAIRGSSSTTIFVRRYRSPVILSCGGIALYTLVHVEDRLVAPFLAVLLLSTVAWATERSEDSGDVVQWACVIFFVASLVAVSLQGLISEIAWASDNSDHFDAAEYLKQTGVQPGTKIALIGSGFEAYFARLADLHIVAEVPDQHAVKFWSSKPETQRGLISSMRTSGAEIVVGEKGGGVPAGWRSIPETDFVFAELHPPEGRR